MGNFLRMFLVMLAVCFLGMGALLTADASGGDNTVASNLILTRPVCDGSMAECLSGDELDELEFQFDSETSRRILASQTKYISYGALNKNRVPCSRRGASYYNCRPGAQANPYSRGCSAITRCKR